MVLKLFGSAQGFSKTPVYVLLEKKVPFEFVKVNRAEKEHKSAGYMEKQPFGQMPYLVS
jgi:glutathione S-transferase